MEFKSKIGVLVTLFLGVIVALVLLPAIASNIQDLSEKRNIVNESVDISVARLAGGTINETYPFTVEEEPTGWRINSCPLTAFLYGNSTTDWTLDADYRVNLSSGIFYLNNTVNVNGTDGSSPNETYVDYDYCTTGYITSSGGRGVAKLILIAAALGLLAYAVYLGAKEFL